MVEGLRRPLVDGPPWLEDVAVAVLEDDRLDFRDGDIFDLDLRWLLGRRMLL